MQSPIVSVLAMTTEGDIHMLQDNATIMFRTMVRLLAVLNVLNSSLILFYVDDTTRYFVPTSLTIDTH